MNFQTKDSTIENSLEGKFIGKGLEKEGYISCSNDGSCPTAHEDVFHVFHPVADGAIADAFLTALEFLQ